MIIRSSPRRKHYLGKDLPFLHKSVLDFVTGVCLLSSLNSYSNDVASLIGDSHHLQVD